MGMYTELNIGVNLREDTPQNVIDILTHMLNDYHCEETPELPKHPLFETGRWRFMLCSDSYYFDGHTDSSMLQDRISKEYELNVRTNLKNYDGEIEKFMDFICPYLKTYGFLGYTRYEEADDPRLIYNDSGKIVYK